jgi:hypothetical protein
MAVVYARDIRKVLVSRRHGSDSPISMATDRSFRFAVHPVKACT